LRILLIAIFGAIGTLARYSVQGFVQVRTGGTFPYGTLLINLSGCFLLGLIGQFTLNRMVISPDWRVAIAVGFFGGHTTFSSLAGRPPKCWRMESGCRLQRMLPQAWLWACCFRSREFGWPTDSRSRA
jgi:protein CrcB